MTVLIRMNNLSQLFKYRIMSNHCSIVYMIFRIKKYFFQKNNVIQYGHLNYVKTKTKQVYLDEIANYLIALSSFLCKPTCVHNFG